MRAFFPLLAAGAVLAACSPGAPPLASTPPSVFYRLSGNDAAQTNDEAQNYCARYGHAAQYRGVTAGANGDMAVYTCDGMPTAPNTAAAPSAGASGSGSTVPPAPAHPE